MIHKKEQKLETQIPSKTTATINRRADLKRAAYAKH